MFNILSRTCVDGISGIFVIIEISKEEQNKHRGRHI